MGDFSDPKGPIQNFSWGSFVIRGEEHSKSGADKRGKGKDIRLIGTTVTRWKERKGHDLTPEMIAGVYGQHLDVLVIGSGVHGALAVPEEVRAAVGDNGIGELVVEPTPKACATYNRLYHAGRKPALLAHGTC